MRVETCHVCSGEILIFYDHGPGDWVHCEDCQREFEICSIDPLVLDPLEPFKLYEDSHMDAAVE